MTHVRSLLAGDFILNDPCVHLLRRRNKVLIKVMNDTSGWCNHRCADCGCSNKESCDGREATTLESLSSRPTLKSSCGRETKRLCKSTASSFPSEGKLQTSLLSRNHSDNIGTGDLLPPGGAVSPDSSVQVDANEVWLVSACPSSGRLPAGTASERWGAPSLMGADS